MSIEAIKRKLDTAAPSLTQILVSRSECEVTIEEMADLGRQREQLCATLANVEADAAYYLETLRWLLQADADQFARWKQSAAPIINDPANAGTAMTRDEWIEKLDELNRQAAADNFEDLVAIFNATILAMADGFAPQAAYVFASFVLQMDARNDHARNVRRTIN